MASDVPKNEDPRRKSLKVAVSALCTEVGFSHAEDICLETLTEMIQSCEYRVSISVCNLLDSICATRSKKRTLKNRVTVSCIEKQGKVGTNASK